MDVIDATVDLLLGAACVGCGRAGRPLCRDCGATLDRGPRPVVRDGGVPPTWAAGSYDGVHGAVAVAFKERAAWTLAGPAARALATAAAAALLGPAPAAVTVVPVPSTAAAVRDRGWDATGVLARRVARLLRAAGIAAHARRVLRLRRSTRDSVGLGREERRANRAGAVMPLRRIRGPVLLLDDIVTTGATLETAAEAIRSGGGTPVAACVLAARGWR